LRSKPASICQWYSGFFGFLRLGGPSTASTALFAVEGVEDEEGRFSRRFAAFVFFDALLPVPTFAAAGLEGLATWLLAMSFLRWMVMRSTPIKIGEMDTYYHPACIHPSPHTVQADGTKAKPTGNYRNRPMKDGQRKRGYIGLIHSSL
jgi:hypothetical protein